MDFEKRLERAIVRGEQTRDAKARRHADEALSEDEFRNLHSKCRLELSERIEACLRKLADHFPGFRFETVVSSDGWGAKISRDDVDLSRGQSSRTQYSRLEMLVLPFSSTHIVELVGKGTIRNKEAFSRRHFQFLSQLDIESFREQIDLWVLEYAELYSARG